MTAPTTEALRDDMLHYEAHVHDNSSDSGSHPGHEGERVVAAHFSAEEEGEHVPVHPDSKVLFGYCPWIPKIPIFGEATEAYGPKCVVSLGLCYLLCKGIADQTISYARYPMLVERYGIDADRYQRLANISTMGWSLKPLTAMLCDAFAFFGYTKRWYMFISCVLGGMFAFAYAALPAEQSSADTAAAFIFLCSFGKASVDVLSEGHYSRLMRKTPKAGPALISWIWWFILLGAIVAAAMQGPLADQGIPQVGVYVSAALQTITCVWFLFNWYGERKNRVEREADARFMHAELIKERQKALEANGVLPTEGILPPKDLHPEYYVSDDDENLKQCREGEGLTEGHVLEDALAPSYGAPVVMARVNPEEEDLVLPTPGSCMCGLFEINKEVFTRNWRVFVYSIVMTCAVVAMTCGSILADTLGLLIICIVVSVACCGTALWSLTFVIAKANIFLYFQQVLYLQIPGALDSFYLATPDCLPNGPHFSNTFYNTVGAVIGNVGGFAGVTAFNYIFSKRSYRFTFIITTIVEVIASLFDLVIVERWNIDIGIPDKAMYLMGDAIVYQVCYMLAWMPMVILLSRLCPRGSESVVYALLAGFSNLGQTTSSSIGAILMEYAWPVISDPPCDFSNVPWLIITGHLALPLLIIPLTFLLIPAARICDNIDIDGKVIKKMAKKEAAEEAEAEAVQRVINENEPTRDEVLSGREDSKA